MLPKDMGDGKHGCSSRVGPLITQRCQLLNELAIFMQPQQK